MKINTLKYYFLNAMKNLKRNSAITIFSVIAVSIAIFIIGIFLLYFLSVNKNSAILFMYNKEMSIALNLIEYAVFIILLFISIFLVVNAIKMTVFIRRNEINIMKLIGATDWFIRWPFIIEGLVIGIAGGIIASLSLFCLYDFIYIEAAKFAPDLVLVPPSIIISKIFIPFEIYGIFIGIIGSIIALRKGLKDIV